ncbi:hypothetical protein Tco_0526247 [Tanacetum coccineum]
MPRPCCEIAALRDSAYRIGTQNTSWLQNHFRQQLESVKPSSANETITIVTQPLVSSYTRDSGNEKSAGIEGAKNHLQLYQTMATKGQIKLHLVRTDNVKNELVFKCEYVVCGEIVSLLQLTINGQVQRLPISIGTTIAGTTSDKYVKAALNSATVVVLPYLITLLQLVPGVTTDLRGLPSGRGFPVIIAGVVAANRHNDGSDVVPTTSSKWLMVMIDLMLLMVMMDLMLFQLLLLNG